MRKARSVLAQAATDRQRACNTNVPIRTIAPGFMGSSRARSDLEVCFGHDTVRAQITRPTDDYGVISRLDCMRIGLFSKSYHRSLQKNNHWPVKAVKSTAKDRLYL